MSKKKKKVHWRFERFMLEGFSLITQCNLYIHLCVSMENQISTSWLTFFFLIKWMN